MARLKPVWPTLNALDTCWESEQGRAVERKKALEVANILKGHVPGRAKILCIGPTSDTMMGSIQFLNPASVFQAYPPAVGIRAGRVPALMMDTDLPPFQRASFDLVILSHVLEYRSSPLALISLAYEILQPQGRLLTVLPHTMSAEILTPGHGNKFFDMQVRVLLRQSAFNLRQAKLLRQGRWRPACLLHLAQPQVPPRPRGRVSILPALEELWRARRTPGIAATGQTGVGPNS